MKEPLSKRMSTLHAWEAVDFPGQGFLRFGTRSQFGFNLGSGRDFEDITSIAQFEGFLREFPRGTFSVMTQDDDDDHLSFAKLREYLSLFYKITEQGVRLTLTFMEIEGYWSAEELQQLAFLDLLLSLEGMRLVGQWLDDGSSDVLAFQDGEQRVAHVRAVF